MLATLLFVGSTVGMAPLPLPPAPPLTLVADVAMTKSSKCTIGTYSFGGKSNAGQDIPVTMTMSPDGWCWLSPKGTKDRTGFVGSVKAMPAHGQAVVQKGAEDRNVFAYKPNDGYVGQDTVSFTIYDHFNHENTLVVTVDVQKAK